MSKMTLRFCALFALLTATSNSFAQTADSEPAGEKPAADTDANAQLAFGSDSGTTAAATAQTDADAPEAAASSEPPANEPKGGWMSRHLPVNGMFELGTGLGLLFPSSEHNLQLERLPHQEINTTAEAFIRAAWMPLSFVGVEGEGALGASSTKDDDVQSYPWSLRAHLLAQLPFWRIAPFALVGFGKFGNVSNQMGADSDPLFHFGGGAKVFLTDDVLMRLDVRDNMSQKNDADDGKLTHSPELMLGISLTLGRPEQKIEQKVCAPEDTDGDGIVDRADKCPSLAGDGRDGCPIPDTDGDGILDDTDRCLNVPGVAPDGCPADSDGDGIVDKDDQCPKEKGEAPTGCPAPKDSDGDGIVDPNDKCPKEAENRNGYEDSDGCPDVVPEKIKAFTGVIQGITFDNNKATIRAPSKPTLDKAAGVLKEFPALRVAISGHTDNVGTREKNLTLSKDRAESVKKYLVEQGVEASRIETRGAGPDEPVDSNATAAGRERNRRIEFKLITGS